MADHQFPYSEIIFCCQVRSQWRTVGDGICEGCETPAPFEKPNGDLYLEVHHIQWLAEGGPDTAENAAGLCPNCHRRAHSSTDKGEFSKSLRDKVNAL